MCDPRDGYATPDEEAPLAVPVATNPAWFSVRPVASLGAFTTQATHKLTRPGVVLLPSMRNGRGDFLSHPEEVRFVRPPDPPPAGVVELAVNSDEAGLGSFRFGLATPQNPDDFPQVQAFGNVGEGVDAFIAGNGPINLRRAPTTARDLRFTVRASPLLPGVTHPQATHQPARDAPPASPTAPYDHGLAVALQGRPHVYDDRLELETWLTLENLDDAYDAMAVDVALFTVTPVIFPCEIDPPERIFALLRAEDDWGRGNFGTISDLLLLAANTQVACSLIRPESNHDDVWCQDAVMLGHCIGPRAWRHVVVQTARRRICHLHFPSGLENEVPEYLADDDTGLFTELTAITGNNSRNAGGNLVPTPPVLVATDAVDPGFQCSSTIPAHPICPYGKLILGDSGAGSASRPDRCHFDFLGAQLVQPVVPIDTSWLKVGHADEVVSFVRAPRVCPGTNCGNLGWAMLLASPDLAVEILQRLSQLEAGEISECRRGVRVAHRTDYTRTASAGRPLRRSVHTWARSLDDSRNRLMLALHLNDDGRDVIEVPVLFTPGVGDAEARFPDMVNFVGLGTALAVPKPWGPRVAPATAATLLTSLAGMNITAGMIRDADLAPLQVDTCWLGPREDGDIDDEIEALYGRGAVAMTRLILRAGDRLPANLRAAGVDLDRVPEGWRAVQVHLDRIDIFEAYMRVRLHNLGLSVTFIDDYAYHIRSGELHCGSKVRRSQRAVTAANRWWFRWEAMLTARLAWD